MRVLMYSPLFYPSIGGLETVALILAQEFVKYGHKLKVVSQVPISRTKTFSFEIIPRPGIRQLVQLVEWSDLYFQPNISLKGVYPLLLKPKPWVISHNNWYCRSNDRLSWQDYLKHFLIRFATNISVSQAVADHITPSSTVIPNPYQEDLFKLYPHVSRTQELVFLGRLVADKGVDLLLNALAILQSKGLTPQLTIIGTGPEESQLRQQAIAMGIAEQIKFMGAKVEQDLAQLLNAHRIMVVPSRWQEPFGIVALEGIACGCVIVGSEGGGLKDAIGDCGVTFPNGNIAVLAQVLEALLSQPEQLDEYRKNAVAHLARHRPAVVAKAYLNVFEEALQCPNF